MGEPAGLHGSCQRRNRGNGVRTVLEKNAWKTTGQTNKEGIKHAGKSTRNKTFWKRSLCSVRQDGRSMAGECGGADQQQGDNDHDRSGAITEEEVPHVDAVLLTHCDNDHYSRTTCGKLAGKTKEFHGPRYVAGLLEEEQGIGGVGHDIGERFQIGDVAVTLTPADHAWQNESPKHHTRDFKKEDFCGFWLDTPDGSIWAVGDSRLMEEQLHMPRPDVMLFDISDSRWHIGLDGVKKMASAYPDTPLILWHWGSVDAPEWKEFNGDPEVVKSLIINPERVVVLAPGEEYCLNNR